MARKPRRERPTSVRRVPLKKPRGTTKAAEAGPQRRPAGSAGRASRLAAAEAAARMKAGMDKEALARGMEVRSRQIAREGLKDVGEAAVLADVSQEIGALGEATRELGQEQVQHGMELAAMAGQLGAMGDTVRAIGLRSLGEFLVDMSQRMRDMAVRDMLQSQGTGALADAMSEATADVADLGAEELAAGMNELAHSEDVAQAGDLVGAIGAVQVAEGVVQAVEAQTPGGPGGTSAAKRRGGASKPA